MGHSERLRELGITLPAVAAPAGSYQPAIRVGDQVWTSGQLPIIDGTLAATGKVGADVSVDDAAHLARTCALNALAAVDSLVGIDNVSRVLKVTGFVASAEGFNAQAAVLNGASDTLAEIFGNAGRHARSAVGVYELPLGSPVEVEIVVEIKE
ncbi:RidA family protein [Corynebacterium sp. CCM 9185]|uniref:RidA family protein n=1 Tax=Corynebacterium marambiense TaxID=2765364 RepID=A0ABS0VTJ3_9CORY|nr:RidA family protein [Corynebacterium marambiense]MBI8999629.1 RidA family protein [Corynebacterium marambiense]MCK7662467.1 RidA family protein [Corynebacterium marambiense]MCX7541755.1 RidA family protein [Corynebacterium marambiense]